MSSSSRITRSRRLLVLLACMAIALILLSSPVLAQDPVEPPPEVTSPEDPPVEPTPTAPSEPSVSPSEPSVSPSAPSDPTISPTDVPDPSFPTTTTVQWTATSSGPVHTPPAALPDPIFSTSDSCVSCKPQFNTIRECTNRVPVNTNLTMISQVLPFYQCICPNNAALLEVLQDCGICLRTTGQTNALSSVFFNVTKQDVKAMRQVCTETENGTKVPSSAMSLWQTLPSVGLTLFMTTAFVVLGGL